MSLMCLEHHEGSPRQQSSQLTWWTATGDVVLTVEIGYRFGCRTTIHSLRGESKPPVIFFQELEVYRSVHSLLLRGSNCSAHSYFLSIQLQILLHPLTIVMSSSPDSPSAPKTAGCPEVHSQSQSMVVTNYFQSRRNRRQRVDTVDVSRYNPSSFPSEWPKILQSNMSPGCLSEFNINGSLQIEVAMSQNGDTCLGIANLGEVCNYYTWEL